MIQGKRFFGRIFTDLQSRLKLLPTPYKAVIQTAGREAAHRLLNIEIQTPVSSDGVVILVPKDEGGVEDLAYLSPDKI